MPDHWPVFTQHCERKNLLPAKHPPSPSAAETMQMPWIRADDMSVLDKPSCEREGLVTLHCEIWHGLVKGIWRKKRPHLIYFQLSVHRTYSWEYSPQSEQQKVQGIKFGKHQEWKQVPHISWGGEIQFLHGQKNRLNTKSTQICRLL